jgi:D-alanyl-D-alanine dipeptidase
LTGAGRAADLGVMRLRLISVCLLLLACASPRVAAPQGNAGSPLVSISDVDPTIIVEARYHGSHNFIGRPITGYEAPKCLLTPQAARALAAVQAEVRPWGLTLKTYDCYRPQRAVDDFVAWARVPTDTAMKSGVLSRRRQAQPLQRRVHRRAIGAQPRQHRGPDNRRAAGRDAAPSLPESR